jgi:hypothetical protein
MGRLKRSTAIHHLRVVCERLDAVNPTTFYIIPLRLYVFGSVLTDKPYVSDLDLLLKYRERPDLDPAEAVYRLTAGKPVSIERAFTVLAPQDEEHSHRHLI